MSDYFECGCIEHDVHGRIFCETHAGKRPVIPTPKPDNLEEKARRVGLQRAAREEGYTVGAVGGAVPYRDTFAPHKCAPEWVAPNGSCARCARDDAEFEAGKRDQAEAALASLLRSTAAEAVGPMAQRAEQAEDRANAAEAALASERKAREEAEKARDTWMARVHNADCEGTFATERAEKAEAEADKLRAEVKRLLEAQWEARG